jgi:ribosomal protein S12 methylthiotransferase
MKFHIVSLGCAKNTADSEALANKFANLGWQWSSTPANTELILVNTCGFIKDAKEESLKTIFKLAQMKEKSPQTKLCVFGCLVKRYEKEIREGIPEVDYLFTFLTEDNIRQIAGLDPHFKPGIDHNKSWRFFTPPHIGILKIAEGCSNKCTYCAIPGIRGPFFSKPEEQILQNAQQLATSGAVEISVVAQDITRYGTDREGRCQLPRLIRKLGKIRGIRWIRLHYMHPRGLDTQLIDELYSLPKVLPYFDIPFQHASDRMLRLMNRNSSPEHHVELIRHIRKNYRNSAIRTTFIVGFPGENNEDFQRLLDFVEQYPLDRVGAFAYSTEEGTPASLIIPKVSRSQKIERLDKLMTLQQLLIEERNRRLINKKVELIIDKVDKNAILARTVWDAFEVDNLTHLSSTRSLKPGQIVNGKITDADAYDFKAKLI